MQKTKNKLLFILLLIFSIILLFACNNKTIETKEISECSLCNYIILPNLENKGRDEIKSILDKLGVKYNLKFDYSSITLPSEYDKFTKYSSPYKAGSEIEPDTFIYVYTTVLPITYYIHDEVKLDKDYENKSFINDGIGEVTLIRNIDGDTAWFKDSTGVEFKLRFYAIDTPESTIENDPWGKAASLYTARALTSAKTIVLEREENHIMDMYGRYLGYVWVDGVLLNLELVEECYTYAAASSSKYSMYFYDAAINAQLTGRRIYGEIDPNYNYD